MGLLLKSSGKMIILLMALILLFNLAIFISKHTVLQDALDDVTSRASANGYIDESFYNQKILNTNLPVDKIQVVKVSPGFNEYVDKLGDSLEIKVIYNYEVNVMDKLTFTIPIPANSVDVNESYYGEGY